MSTARPQGRGVTESVSGYEGLGEYELQGELAPVWTHDGLVIEGRHCFLLAWEMKLNTPQPRLVSVLARYAGDATHI